MEAGAGPDLGGPEGDGVDGCSGPNNSDLDQSAGEFDHGDAGQGVGESHTMPPVDLRLGPFPLAMWRDAGRGGGGPREPGGGLRQATVLIQPRRKISNGRLISPCHFPRGLKQSREQFSSPGTAPSGSWR